MDRTALVVGAGMTGLAAAEWLRRDGWSVTLVDPVEPGDPQQASFGNAGLLARTSVMPVATPALVRKAPMMALKSDAPLFLRWSYLPRLLPWLLPFLRNATPDRIRSVSAAIFALTHDSNDQHDALARNTGAEAFIQRGEFIDLYPDAADYHSGALAKEIEAKNGVTPELLTRDQLLDRDPHLGPRYTCGAMIGDFNWLATPAAYLRTIYAHYRAHGGQFRQAKVADITPGQAPSVTLEGGESLFADKIVLSAGAWSKDLAQKLGLPIKLEAERGYHVTMFEPTIQPPNPYMITDAKFVITPMGDRLRAAGLVELAGIDAPEIKPPTQFIRNRLKQVYPTLAFERSEAWMGRRPTTPDSLPVIGESPRAPGILHAYGGQHVGLTIGPRVGRLVADLAKGLHPNLDLAPYDPDRF